jgi:TonB family protein
MPKPILYRPAPRWQFWAYLGGALLVHGVAVVAAIKHEAPPADLNNIPTAEVIATLETPTDEPTPPPEDIPLPEPPPVPEVQPEFQEESTPPPKRPPNQKVAPVKAPTVGSPRPPGMMSISGAKALAINSPRPEYPYEARSRRITGSGVCVVTVDTGSGAVTDATMAQSLGNPILDNSAMSAFRRWRFKPGTVAKVKIPITFTMTGASY